MSLPEAFVERLGRIVPPQWYARVMATFDTPKQVSFRINRLKSTLEEVESRLDTMGLEYTCVEEGVYTIPPHQKHALTHSSLWEEGKIYVQNRSSMIAPRLLDPQAHESILDLAAAPGGKTLLLAELMGNTGWLSAVEPSKERFFRLRANLDHQGVSNAHTYCSDGRSIGKKCPLRFDRVLLDAPCSSEARFRSDDPSSTRYWSLAKVKESSKLQRRLLLSAYDTLKVGGRLLYCTCSFAPEENEGSLHYLLERHGEHLQTLPIDLGWENIQAPLSQWGKEVFDPRIANAVRILPTDAMDGFFICLLEKQ